MEHLDGHRHVLLSSLDETVIQHDSEFNLGIHKYSGDVYNPKGHKYLRDFEAETIARLVYRVGGVVLQKESLLVEKEEQILIRYTLLEAQSNILLKLRPFCAFRNIHELSKANLYANTASENIKNGVKIQLYAGYPHLHLQTSKKSEYVHVPDWYYGIEYMQEQVRGYDYKEDIMVPGYFEVNLKTGESFIFSASTKESSPSTLQRKFKAEVEKRLPRSSFINCLRNAAEQFIIKDEKETKLIAGFPWFGSWGRDTFIALPGLTLSMGNPEACKNVLDSMVESLEDGLFPNDFASSNNTYNSVDAPLWFSWALQQFSEYIGDGKEIWGKYGKYLKEILRAYKSGTRNNIHMLENGLIWAGGDKLALTWMDAVVEGRPVTPRNGMAVEVNALWYNAVMYSLYLAGTAGDATFIGEWEPIANRIKESFVNTFWDDQKGYLADVVNGNGHDWSVRPNQVFATCFQFIPLKPNQCKSILDVIESELLTPKGLRTLSPKNLNYRGTYEGNQSRRDHAYHQGSVWPWLLEHFCRGYLKIHKRSGLTFVKKILTNFEEDMMTHGIGTISEIYDGDPPHFPRGAISQAWSVGALLRLNDMIEEIEREGT
jgi:predicted glycogen debranching enzyme